MKLPVKVTINGQSYSHEVEPRLLLVHYIREVVGLTGTHVGCDTSQCGACTILMNGQAVKACTLFTVQADGASIMTIEGLAKNGELHPIQMGFWCAATASAPSRSPPWIAARGGPNGVGRLASAPGAAKTSNAVAVPIARLSKVAASTAGPRVRAGSRWPISDTSAE